MCGLAGFVGSADPLRARERVQRMLGALGLDIAVTPAEHAALVAVIEGRHGRVELR